MNTTNLSRITNYVGIDISKQKLDCWLRPIGAHLCCGNDARGFDRLLVALTEAGWPTAVEKTTMIDKVGPDHDRKDDTFDAMLIAEYADRFSDQLPLTTPPEEALDQITQLYSERRRSATKTKQTRAA